MTDRERLCRYFNEEVARYHEETRYEDHEDDALKSVCHVIHWACALDEFLWEAPGYEAFRDGDPDGQHLPGVRYARDRATHQPTQLLVVTGGAAFPIQLPAPLFEIAWKELALLPPPDPDHDNGPRKAAQKAAYSRLLESQPVRFTFDALSEFFAKVP